MPLYPRRTPSGRPSQASAHPWETASTDLAQYIADQSKALPDMLRSGGRAPWQASMSNDAALGYYRAVFSGQGPESPQELEQRIGEEAYQNAQRAVILHTALSAQPQPPVAPNAPPMLPGS